VATALPVIHRYEIPVDDRWHYLNLPRGLQHVACRRTTTVEIWAYAASPGDAPSWRQFRVYGTGQPMPIASVHIATAICPGGDLVWHLVENACTHIGWRGPDHVNPERPGWCAMCGAPLEAGGSV
jgi:hypothetical protein